jgi:hypothetical protein
MYNHVFSLARDAWLRRTLTVAVIITLGPLSALSADRRVLVEHFADTG